VFLAGYFNYQGTVSGPAADDDDGEVDFGLDEFRA